MKKNENTADKYKKAADDRQAYVTAILNSESKKVTVVAGPGTGKTFLFKTVLTGKTNCLTLTFVNALVEDLSLDLCNLSEVKTLHGYARGVIGSNVKVFPKLSEVIKQDAEVLLGAPVDFDKIFHDRDDENEFIDFYLKRKSYYDKYYGYSSIIYAAVKLLELKSDRIPVYQQVLVDEFQDFNKLEVSLIELLASKSPVLLAGDDDQALYGFKGASADHIRQLHNSGNKEYKSFTLPYCSRSTRVIVDAVNDLVCKAVEKGHLCGRIAKGYRYFEDEAKDKESEQYPQLVHAQVHYNQIPWFIHQRIEELAGEQRREFSNLIIATNKDQCRFLATKLREKGLAARESVAAKEDNDIDVLDGFRLLMKDNKSNLGWRIAAKHCLSAGEFRKLLEQTTDPNAKRISDIIDPEVRKKIKRTIKNLKGVKNERKVEEADLNDILKELGMDGQEIIRKALYDRIAYSYQRIGNPGLRKLPVKVTTIQSSKGLSVDFVFITFFDDKYFIREHDKGTITDQDICNFIVSLTRAKKKVFLVSTNVNSEPTFLNWIDKSRIEKLS